MTLNPLDIIESNEWELRDVQPALRLIQGGLSEVAGAGVVGEASVGGVEVASAIISATAAVIMAVVLLCILLIFVGLVLLHNTIRHSVASIPLIGDKLAALTDFANGAILSVGHWVQDETLSVWTGILSDVHRAVAGLISVLGIPSLSQLQHALAGVSSRLARLPYDIDALENRVMKALRDSLASVWQNISQIWSWVHAILANVHALQFAVHQIWNWLHLINHEIAVLTSLVNWLKGQVSKLWHETQYLQKEVNKLTKEVHQLQTQIVQLQHRVIVDEHKLAPAAEAAATVALLLPLLDLGAEGIKTLTELQEDPCRCLFIPGSKGFMLTSIVAYLWWRDGP